MDLSGWSTKGSRQQKKNVRKPVRKPRATPNGAAPKRKRNRKRRSAKPQRDPIEVVIDQIAQGHPNFAADRDLLRAVVQDLNLRSFQSTDRDQNKAVLDCIIKHRQSKLRTYLDEEEEE